LPGGPLRFRIGEIEVELSPSVALATARALADGATHALALSEDEVLRLLTAERESQRDSIRQ